MQQSDFGWDTDSFLLSSRHNAVFSFKNSIDIKLIAARGQAGHWSMSCEQLIVHNLVFLGFISLSLSPFHYCYYYCYYYHLY